MGRPVTLEEFNLSNNVLPAFAPETESEAARLSNFEQGYQAGWDDASNAISKDNGRLTADIEANLRDLAFTYHEARTHVLKGIEPLLKEIIAKILPETAKQALPQLVFETVRDTIESAGAAPVTLMVSSQSRNEIEAVFPRDFGFPVDIREEPTLAEGQVFFRAGQIEKAVDAASAIQEVSDLVDDFFTINDEQRAVG